MNDRFKGEIYEANLKELAEFQAAAFTLGWAMSIVPKSDKFKITFFEAEDENGSDN